MFGDHMASMNQQLVAAGMPVSRLRSNDLLGKDWFKALDSTIQQVARSRMRTVGFLIENGLGYTIDENMAMATTILEWQVASDMGPATVSMELRPTLASWALASFLIGLRACCLSAG